MQFRGLNDMRGHASCSVGSSASAHPSFPLSRLSRLVGSARVLRAAPLIGIGGALGIFAASRLAGQRASRDGSPRSTPFRLFASAGNAPSAEATTERAASPGETQANSAEGGSGTGSTPADPSTDRRGSGNGASPSSALRLDMAAALLPHPQKADRGGEDAVFLGDDSLSFGIADGVGAWIDMGVDPGIYARELMAKCKEAAARVAPCKSAPVNILTNGFYDTTKMGSCTACILVLEGSVLHAANLGDSGFMVLRGKRVVFRSRTQQHQFNFPYQLGRGGRETYDPPSSADQYSIELAPGDIIMAATDGLWDNVFDAEAAQLLHSVAGRSHTPAAAANTLAQFAHMRAADPEHLSPFSVGAQRLGYQHIGGKMDDIAVVVAYVVPASKL